MKNFIGNIIMLGAKTTAVTFGIIAGCELAGKILGKEDKKPKANTEYHKWV